MIRYRGDNCRFNHKAGENWVPWGDTMVKEGDDYACSLGYDAAVCDCPDDVPEPDELDSMRASHGKGPGFWQRADYERDRRV